MLANTSAIPGITMNDQPDPQRIERLRENLMRRRRDLQEDIARTLERSGEERNQALAGAVRDEGDASVADLLVDLEMRGIERQRAEIHEIDAALRRMAEQRYGRCEDCGRDIEPERLAAYPTATRCIECQSAHESHHESETASL